MKKKIDIKSLVLGALLGAVVVFSVAAATTFTPNSWNYRIVAGPLGNGNPPGSPTLESELNAAAADGWEFLQVSASATQGPFAVLRKLKNQR